MNADDRRLAFERMNRAAKLATTYLRKAEALLYPYRRGDSVFDPPPPSPWYWDLLKQALETAHAIVENLPDDFFDTEEVADYLGLGGGTVKLNMSDDSFECAAKILRLLDDRRGVAKRGRRIRLLENTTGRTPAEAQAYRAKAAELRGQKQHEGGRR